MADIPLLALGVNKLNAQDTFNNALMNVRNYDAIQQARAQEERAAAMAPYQQQMAQQQVQAGQTANQANDLKFRQQDIVNDAFQMKRLITNNAAPEQVNAYFDQRIAKVSERGGNPIDTMRAKELYNSGNIEGLNAALDQTIEQGRQYGIIGTNQQGMTADVQNRNALFDIIKPALNEQGQFDPAIASAQQRAAAIELGLVPRATGSSAITTATTPGLTQQVASSEAVIAGNKAVATETGKLTSQLKLKPQVEAAVKVAVNAANNASDVAKEDRTNARALSVYDTAMTNLNESLGGTTTGPVAGWLPSVTADQQIADGAVAAMAPVLKSMFRTAGEGTFTDKDQELLLNMVPTRKDLPEARAAKIKAIDAIVRAKLGPDQQKVQPIQQQTTQPSPSQQPQRIRFDAKGNIIQ